MGSDGLCQPNADIYVGAFSIELAVTSEDPSWSSGAVKFELPSLSLISGTGPALAAEPNAVVVHAKDSDTYELVPDFPHQQFVREGDEVIGNYTINTAGSLTCWRARN